MSAIIISIYNTGLQIRTISLLFYQVKGDSRNKLAAFLTTKPKRKNVPIRTASLHETSHETSKNDWVQSTVWSLSFRVQNSPAQCHFNRCTQTRGKKICRKFWVHWQQLVCITCCQLNAVFNNMWYRNRSTLSQTTLKIYH